MTNTAGRETTGAGAVAADSGAVDPGAAPHHEAGTAAIVGAAPLHAAGVAVGAAARGLTCANPSG